MGMFSRITDIINANINALLDKAENPEKMIRLIVQEMEETLVEVRCEAAKYIAEKKQLTRALERINKQDTQWQEKAELALSKGREDLARSALVEKQKLAQELSECEQSIQHIDDVLTAIQTDSQHLQNKLSEAKARQHAIVTRQQTAEVRLQTKKVLDTGDIDRAIAKFEHYQQKVDDLEAQVDAYDVVANQSLADQIAELEQQDAIAQQLEKLKQRVVNS
ncbi:phage shock protein PspA [Thalassotalea ponticola]|uniref:phage shock protein PspA n=1 Tax=Thalassotalea ponticola TaxID=1523392 RepID=UPI0025B5F950|nr:phage shock protein PspA [Thalassotalea ponticola]MDN3653772.1 phage shock protein PspA [Thalassotalea ponticola]